MARKNQDEVATVPANDPTPATDTSNATITAHAEYKLAGDIPEALKGKLIKTPEAATLDQMHLLVEGGKSENVLKLAQAQFDIIIQRKLRDAATSDEIAEVLAGKVVEIDGEKLDFSGMNDAERQEYAVSRVQAVADDFRYGARPLIAGGGTKAAKEALGREAGLKKAAAADPELAAKLAALGYTL